MGAQASESSNNIDFSMTSRNVMKSAEVIEFKVPFSQFILSGSTNDVICQSFGVNGNTPVLNQCTAEVADSGEFFFLRY